ncbi:MAG: NapC/NirT family cytochrome c [Gammaproteobacteria bacterium]|jgi:nitrate/TMAO reductase-like tetraheme cytochrome c subunit
MQQTDSNNNGDGRGLWRRPRVWFLLGIPLGGFLMFFIGAIALGTFNKVMAYTNTLEFCTSCHEMKDFLFEEYKETVHYQNASGVRAVCSDCHVPHEWFPKVARKIQASFRELPAKVLGVIDTREKFDAKRLELAEDVWAGMKATNSRECRNCHSVEAMKLAEQDRSARKKHSLERMQKRGESCIDCHKGIAHKLPEGYEG